MKSNHHIDKLWYDKARQALTQIAKDMASDVRVTGFLAWVRQSQKNGQVQGRTYGAGVLPQKSFEKLADEAGLDVDELSPVVAFRDKVITGRKNTRHTAHNDALDEMALQKIVREFGRPDWELWDKSNGNLLLIYQTSQERAIKLTVQLDKKDISVISGFYVNADSIIAGIKGGEFLEIK